MVPVHVFRSLTDLHSRPLSTCKHIPPPPELGLTLKTYAKCAWPGLITPVTRAMSMAGACECSFTHPFCRVDDVTQAMSKGGGYLWMSFHPPPPPSGNPVSAAATGTIIKLHSPQVIIFGWCVCVTKWTPLLQHYFHKPIPVAYSCFTLQYK